MAYGTFPSASHTRNFAGTVDPCLSETFTFEQIPHVHQLMHDNKHPHGNMACLVNATKPGQREL